MTNEYHRFSACCAKRHCEDCPGSYFDKEDSDVRHVCSCDHHRQAPLFAAEEPEPKQRKLL